MLTMIGCDDMEFEGSRDARSYLGRKQDPDRQESVGKKTDYIQSNYRGSQPAVLVLESPFRFKTTVVFGQMHDIVQYPGISGAIRPWIIHSLRS